MTLKENTHVIRYYEKIKEYKTLELFFEATNLELEVFKENKFVYLKDLLNDASIDKTIKCNLTDETLKVIENANSFTRRDRTCGTWAGRLEGIPGKNLFNNALIVRLLENTMNEKLSREEWKAQVLKVLEINERDPE